MAGYASNDVAGHNARIEAALLAKRSRREGRRYCSGEDLREPSDSHFD